MADKILPLRFFKAWIRNANKIKLDLCSNWNNLTSYTSLIQNNKECILHNIAEDFKLKYFREYYSLDAVFYNDDDKVPNLNPNWVWLQNIQIAFEHEHYIKNTYQEISHLSITNCQLRVLVTYPNDDENKFLDSYDQIIRANKTLDANESFLVIFGYKGENNVTWDGWLYANDQWNKLE